MKILSAAQIRQADEYTINHEPVSSVDLMERAAHACTRWLLENTGKNVEYAVVCGPGNNGGDGFALARLLKKEGCVVHAFAVGSISTRSKDNRENYERLHSSLRTDVSSVADLSPIKEADVVIDALFGSGLNRPADGFAAEIINAMNASGKRIIAIDVPSGLFCDKLNDKADPVVRAEQTLSFQFPKHSFMLPENFEFVGEFSVLDIQLHPDFIMNVQTQESLVLREDLSLPERPKASHKGNFGHALLVAGSRGKMGAAALAAKACCRTGAGLVTAHVPGCGVAILQTIIPEAMVSQDEDESVLSRVVLPGKCRVVGIGPGIGKDKKTVNALKEFIPGCKLPLVLDADALNIISEFPELLSSLPADTVLTPHYVEFERLAGKAKDHEQRLEFQRNFSKRYKVHVVLKGPYTSISLPDGKVFYNSTGNPGMATGGSGDVLTGMITSLLAQGYPAEEACKLGVFLHGLAGDFAALEKSEEGMIASDIIDNIPVAFNFVRS
jgi:NAD(P)H-hydrate epimerase